MKLMGRRHQVSKEIKGFFKLTIPRPSKLREEEIEQSMDLQRRSPFIDVPIYVPVARKQDLCIYA
jgi:hypothetical protein